VAGRVFLGWGPAEHADQRQAEQSREEEDEQSGTSRDRTPPLMVLVPGLLLAGAIVIGLIPGAVPGIEVAAAHFGDQLSYIGWVLHGHVHFSPVSTSHVESFDYAYGAAAAAGAVAVAALALFGGELRARLPKLLLRPVLAGVDGLRALHSGHIGDYVAWWTAGAAALGGTSLIFLR
jgi:multicomponent Na+:H+ antiporter subunit D